MAEVMKEMVDREDWERMDKGLPPKKRGRPVKASPPTPEVKEIIGYDDIPIDKAETFVTARRRIITGEEGEKHIGFDITLKLKGAENLSGWMIEGEFLKLRRMLGDKVDPTKIAY